MASKSIHNAMELTFLGTASAKPSSTRNHSSLALRYGGDVWLFDCGEATQHMLQKSTVKMGKINKVFITHTHGDHIFGLVPLLASRMNGAGGMTEGYEDERTKPTDLVLEQEPFEIYGPLGTREYVRSALRHTYTRLDYPYVVHELRFPHDPVDGRGTFPLDPKELSSGREIALEEHEGRQDWTRIFANDAISVSAAPILHSVPCVGYVVDEAPLPEKMDPKQYVPHLKRTGTNMSALSQLQRGEDLTLSDGTVLKGLGKRPGRKLVILGDTYDASGISHLAQDADVLIHEATNAHLPGIDPMTKDEDTFEIVEERARSRGHSTPQVAGRFAKMVNARKLILNHFSPRYKGNDDNDEEAKTVMEAIRSLAVQEFPGDVVCARDLMDVVVGLQK